MVRPFRQHDVILCKLHCISFCWVMLLSYSLFVDRLIVYWFFAMLSLNHLCSVSRCMEWTSLFFTLREIIRSLETKMACKIYSCFVSSWTNELFIWNTATCNFSCHGVWLYFIHKVFCQRCVLCGMLNALPPSRDLQWHCESVYNLCEHAKVRERERETESVYLWV